jgi:hypothetical protein
MSIINSATTAITNAANTVVASSGLATGVSGVIDSISSAASGFLTALTSLGVKLPLRNVLSNYASYNYIIGLSALTVDEFNFPDKSYKAGKTLPLICKSAGINPSNRVNTQYGKYDYFIDNLTTEGIIGYINGKGSNVTNISFDVFEPYSLGVFMLSIQQAAYNAGHKNWRDCPFLLTIDFMGSNELGNMSPIPATRHIPIKFTNIGIKASEKGTVYNILAYGTNGQAHTTQFSNLRSDVSLKGATVQEILQTGEQSLQAVVNKKLKSLETNKTVAKADEIVIIFPTETQIPSGASIAANSQTSERSSTATATPGSPASAGSLYRKLGLITNQINAEQVQSAGDCNELGKATMGYNLSDKKADPAMGKEAAVWNEKAGTWNLGKVVTNPSEGTLKFSQDTDILTAIEAVLLTSSYPEKALDPTNIDSNGFRKWWRIDTQVYMVDTDSNESTTGTKPRVIVYRVIPYSTHSSKITAPNAKATGFDNIKRVIVKQYEYLYTGKNTEVIRFDIDFSVNFAVAMAADNYKGNMDNKRVSQAGLQQDKISPSQPLGKGQKASDTPGSNPTQVRNDNTGSASDKKGGGGQETAKTRAARVWHDAITSGLDMVTLDMEIIGDPFWIHHSGAGNYTSPPAPGIKDLNRDGSVNWQNGEVDILVNFRSPLDINQATGLYDFNMALNTGSPDAPVQGWSGLYCVNRVTNSFRGGKYRCTLKGYRRPLQENKGPGTTKGALGNPVPDDGSKGYEVRDETGQVSELRQNEYGDLYRPVL